MKKIESDEKRKEINVLTKMREKAVNSVLATIRFLIVTKPFKRSSEVTEKSTTDDVAMRAVVVVVSAADLIGN